MSEPTTEPTEPTPTEETDMGLAHSSQHPRYKGARRKRGKKENAEEIAEKAGASAQMDLEEYCDQYNFDMPGMKAKLTRLAPRNLGNVPIAGHCETKEGSGYSLEEVKERFGGGTYRVNVSGPRELGGMIVNLGSKMFEVGGPPKYEGQASILETGGAHPTQQGGSGNDIAPQAQAAMVGVMGKMMDRAHESRSAEGASPDLFHEMRESVESSARQQVEAIREASRQENGVLRGQLDELRQTAEELRAELRAREHAADKEVGDARHEASSLVTSLLPTFSEQANQRAQDAQREASALVSRAQEQAARDIAAADQRAQMHVENIKTMFQAQSVNQQSMYDGRVQQLQGEIQLLRTRNEHLESELRTLRDRNTELLLEQTKKHDPMNIMQQAANLKDAAEGLLGGGGGGDGMGLSDDASDVMKLGNSFLQSLGAFAPIIQSKIAGQGAGPQQMAAQPQMAPPQAPPQRRMVRRAPPQQAQQAPPQLAPMTAITPQAPQAAKKPAPKARLRRQDLVAGVRMLNSALMSETAPDRAADTAAQTLDRATLKELVRRKPRAVYASLESNGILDGALATPEGEAYLTEFLRALRARLSGATYSATPQPQATEPTDESEPEGIPGSVEEVEE